MAGPGGGSAGIYLISNSDPGLSLEKNDKRYTQSKPEALSI